MLHAIFFPYLQFNLTLHALWCDSEPFQLFSGPRAHPVTLRHRLVLHWAPVLSSTVATSPMRLLENLKWPTWSYYISVGQYYARYVGFIHCFLPSFFTPSLHQGLSPSSGCQQCSNERVCPEGHPRLTEKCTFEHYLLWFTLELAVCMSVSSLTYKHFEFTVLSHSVLWPS